jgi:MFS family permease
VVEAGASTAPPPHASFGAWWMLIILLSLYIVSFIDRYAINMLVPNIKASLHLRDSQMGLVLGPAFSFFYAAFGFPLGWAADRFSRRWVIFLGAVLFGCATISSAAAQTFAALFVARACVAIGEASLSPAAYSLMSDKFPRNLLATASAIYNTASKIGSAAAYAIGGLALGLAAGLRITAPMLGQLEPWRMVLAMTGAPAILIALLVFTFRDPPRKQIQTGQADRSNSAIAYMVANRQLMGPLLCGFALEGLCASALTSWVPTYLTRHYDLAPGHFGPILGAINLTAAAGLVVTGLLVDWLYSRGSRDIHIRFYTWLLAASMPFACTMFFINNAAVFMIMYGVVQVVAMTMIVYVAATIQLIVPAELKGRVISIFLLAISVLGLGIGPMVVGFLTDYLFRDDFKLGWSLAVIVIITLPLTLIILRMALKPLRETMDQAAGLHGAAHRPSGVAAAGEQAVG